MAKVRYDIIVRTSSRGVRKQDVAFNRQPLRPGSVEDAFNEVVTDQYKHLGFGVRNPFLPAVTRYPVRGLRFRGVGMDDTDVVMMFCPQTRAAVVVKVVRHEGQ